jgi:hypothetical protein
MNSIVAAATTFLVLLGAVPAQGACRIPISLVAATNPGKRELEMLLEVIECLNEETQVMRIKLETQQVQIQTLELRLEAVDSRDRGGR